MPVRRRRGRGAHPPDPGRRLRLERARGGGRLGAGLRLPGPRRLGSRLGAPLQPREAAPRPLRPRDRRRGGLGSGRPRPRAGRPGSPRRDRFGAVRAALGGLVRAVRLGGRPPPRHPDAALDHLRGPRQGLHGAQPGDPRGDPRHLRRPGPPRRDRAPDPAGRDGDRAAARASDRPRREAGRARPAQLLGLPDDRLLRAPRRLRRGARGHAGDGVQVDGPRAPRGRDRGDPRRGVQPHRRGRRGRPDAVPARHRQRQLTIASRTIRACTWTTPGAATPSTSIAPRRCAW